MGTTTVSPVTAGTTTTIEIHPGSAARAAIRPRPPLHAERSRYLMGSWADDPARLPIRASTPRLNSQAFQKLDHAIKLDTLSVGTAHGTPQAASPLNFPAKTSCAVALLGTTMGVFLLVICLEFGGDSDYDCTRRQTACLSRFPTLPSPLSRNERAGERSSLSP